MTDEFSRAEFSQAEIAAAAERRWTAQREEYEQWLDEYDATLPPRAEKVEFLVSMPAQKLVIGTLPGFLYLATSYADLQNALDAGGTDVSESGAAWEAYERDLNEEYLRQY